MASLMCLYPSGWEAWDEWEAPSFPWLCAFYAKVKNKKEVELTYLGGMASEREQSVGNQRTGFEAGARWGR